jgi:hypothetical protein
LPEVARAALSATLLIGCWRDPPTHPAIAHAPAAPPAPLVLEWDGAPGGGNPGKSDHALALFPDDEWGRVLPCPQALAPHQPASPDRHRCAYPATGSLVIADTTLWAAETAYHHEFDGMYGSEEGVVLLDPAVPTRPIATLSQWLLDVVDCRTTLRQRRQRTLDLDGDGRAELCVESIDEAGVGLFPVLELGDHGQVWQPNVRTRDLVAFTYDLATHRLRRLPTLDGRCPLTGYAPFVAVPAPEARDPIAYRRVVQGTPPVAPCPPDLADSCFDVCTP